MLFLFGTISMVTATVKSLGALVAIRLLLGAFESGVIPTMLASVGTFYGSDSLGFVWEMTAGLAIGAVGFVGGPLAAGIFAATKHAGALEGWQWLFVIEGMPTIAVGVMIAAIYPSSVTTCRRFLSQDEFDWLARHTTSIQEEKRQKTERRRAGSESASGGRKVPRFVSTAVELIRDVRVLVLVASQFLWVILLNAAIFWVPAVLSEGRGISSAASLTAIPNAVGTVTSLIAAWSSDRTRERPLHMAGALLLAALGFALTAVVVTSGGAANVALSLSTISLTYGGIGAFPGPAVAAASDILPGDSAAVGFGLISTIGTLGGVCGPSVVGIIKETTGNFSIAWVVMACIAAAAAVVAAQLRWFSRVKLELLQSEGLERGKKEVMLIPNRGIAHDDADGTE